VAGQGTEHLEVVDVAPIPAADRPFGEGQLAVDQALGVEELLNAEAVAGRAGAGRVVEGKHLRFQLADRVPADRAGEARRKDGFLAGFAFHRRHQRDAVGQAQRGLEGLGQALLQVGTHLETVDHDLDGVLLLLVQLGQVVEFVELAVDPRADEALGAHFLEHREVLALALANDRREQHQLGALGHRQYLIDHLADGLRLQRDVVVRAARRTDAGIEQAQVVVDLGDGADGGARIVRGGLLLDGDRRGQPFDGVHVGLFHHREELPGVGGERLHIAALPLCVERVEGQGRFSGAGQAGDHDEFVAGEGEVDVLQVVGTSPTDQDLVQNSLAWRAKTHEYTDRRAGASGRRGLSLTGRVREGLAAARCFCAGSWGWGLVESPPCS